jgi:hypothetical protein
MEKRESVVNNSSPTANGYDRPVNELYLNQVT